jgi:anti-sigma factor RsiW
MNSGNCHRERQAIAATHSGEWSVELRAHLARCPACADAVLVAEFLQTEQETANLPAPPSGGQVWWKAQIRARRQDAERALEPVCLVQRIAVGCLLAALFVLSLHYAPQLRTWAGRLTPAALGAEEPLAEVFLGSAVAFLGVVSAGLGFMLHSSK